LHRRGFLKLPLLAALAPLQGRAHADNGETGSMTDHSDTRGQHAISPLTLFLCGDVMTGRGIDQVLPYPSEPSLYEPYIRSAVDYVRIAERANGRIPRPVSFDYVWGDALQALDEAAADVRIINLETAITRSDDYWPGKGINYRMHPHNLACLGAAGVDCCVLANNHVLDWGHAGLRETLATLRQAGIKTAGAGEDLAEAMQAAIFDIDDKRRVIVFSFGSPTSGIPPAWSASADRAGVWLLPDFSRESLAAVARQARALKRSGDVLVASIHWGGNWGYRVPREQRRFAHALIDEALVDVVHGHSSHHPKGIEVYRERLILYGCGDFLNDYEGISSHEKYRGDLTLMYLPKLDARDGRLLSLRMRPMQVRRFRLNHASQHDARWLARVLDSEGRKLGTGIELDNGSLWLRWP